MWLFAAWLGRIIRWLFGDLSQDSNLMCVNPRMMDPPGMNPHVWITKQRTREQALAGSPHVWKCHYCPAQGTIEELAKVACTHVYPPCSSCGQTPECAPDCRGVAAALADPGVHVAAGPPRGSA